MKKNTIFAKSAIWAMFYFTPRGFQCTVKGIFIPKNLKLGEISTKEHFNIFDFPKKLKEWGSN